MSHPDGVANGHHMRPAMENRSTTTDPHPPAVRTTPVSLVGPMKSVIRNIVPETVVQGTVTSRQEHRFPT